MNGVKHQEQQRKCFLIVLFPVEWYSTESSRSEFGVYQLDGSDGWIQCCLCRRPSTAFGGCTAATAATTRTKEKAHDRSEGRNNAYGSS